jgi:hypothetical protein
LIAVYVPKTMIDLTLNKLVAAFGKADIGLVQVHGTSGGIARSSVYHVWWN